MKPGDDRWVEREVERLLREVPPLSLLQRIRRRLIRPGDKAVISRWVRTSLTKNQRGSTS